MDWDIQRLIIYKNIDLILLIPQHGLWGGQFGEVHQFKNGKIIRHTSVINNVKVRSIKDKKGITLHNFRDWVKFQHYADKNL